MSPTEKRERAVLAAPTTYDAAVETCKQELAAVTEA